MSRVKINRADPYHRIPLILIVDDDADSLLALETFFKNEPFEIALSSGGTKALDFIRRRCPDLILLDVSMPDLDGFEVCRQLKASSQTAGIPVIFLTGRNDPEDVLQGFALGAVDYVMKPFALAEVKARVRTHLQLQQLKGLLSVCMHCSRIQESDGVWEPIEGYFNRTMTGSISNCLCPECRKKYYPTERM